MSLVTIRKHLSYSPVIQPFLASTLGSTFSPWLMYLMALFLGHPPVPGGYNTLHQLAFV